MVQTSPAALSRRGFLKLAALAPFFVGQVAAARVPEKSAQAFDAVPHLNPGFRIREISGDAIALVTHLGDGRRLAHELSGLDADLMREIARDRPLGAVLDAVCRRRRLPPEKCRKQARVAMDDFKKRRWIYYGEKMTVKRVEIRRVR